MKKVKGPILDGKDREETGLFGNKTNKISEIRDILHSGSPLKEKKAKQDKNRKNRLDE